MKQCFSYLWKQGTSADVSRLDERYLVFIKWRSCFKNEWTLELHIHTLLLTWSVKTEMILWRHRFSQSQRHYCQDFCPLYNRPFRLTSLEQLGVAEFSGEQARSKVYESSHRNVLSIWLDMVLNIKICVYIQKIKGMKNETCQNMLIRNKS